MLKPTATAAQRRADNAVIRRALKLLEDRLGYGDRARMTSPRAVRDFLRLRLGQLEHEVFAVLWLDAQNRLIDAEDIFRGTLTQTSVYPREVVKSALAHNAGAAILAHNHPSGQSEPSAADIALTENLKRALALVDVKLLDHFIVGGASEPLSFAERGLL